MCVYMGLFMLAAGLVLGAGLGRVRERCGKQAGAPCVTRGAVQGSSTPLVPAQDILSSDGKVSVEGCSVLDIQDWDGGEEGTGRLSEALSKQDHQVVALHLSGFLGDDGATNLAKALQSPKGSKIYELLLMQHGVGSEGAAALAEASDGLRAFNGLDLAGIRSKEVTKVDAAARGFQLLEATVLARELRRPNAITDLNIGFSTAPEVLRILGYNDEL